MAFRAADGDRPLTHIRMFVAEQVLYKPAYLRRERVNIAISGSGYYGLSCMPLRCQVWRRDSELSSGDVPIHQDLSDQEFVFSLRQTNA